MLSGANAGLAKSVDNAFPSHDGAYHFTGPNTKGFCQKIAMRRHGLKRAVLRLLSEMSPVRIRPGSPPQATKKVTAHRAKQKLTSAQTSCRLASNVCHPR